MMVFVDSFRAKISFIFLMAKSFIDIIQRVFDIFLGNDIEDGTILRCKTARGLRSVARPPGRRRNLGNEDSTFKNT